MDLTINDLPTEMLSKILVLSLKNGRQMCFSTGVKKAKVLALVAKTFQAISINLVLPAICKSLYFSPMANPFIKHGPYIKKVIHEHCSTLRIHTVPLKIAYAFTRLKKLELTGFSDVTNEMLKNMSHLKHLQLNLQYKISEPPKNLIIDESFVNLQSLAFNGKTVASVKSKTIKILNMFHATHITTEELESLPKLCTLYLLRASSINPCKLTNLTGLYVDNKTSNIKNLSNLKKLTHLTLASSNAINDDLKNLDNLKVLTIDNHSIDVEGVNYCKNLTKLCSLESDGHWFDDTHLQNKNLIIKRIPQDHKK